MRLAFWVYGLLYLLFEVLGQQLESIGWVHLTALDIAEAITHAALVVAIVLAVVVLGRLGAERLAQSIDVWHSGRQADREDDDLPFGDVDPITVTSWRDEPLALTSGPSWTPVSPARYPMPDGPLDGGAPYR